VSVRFVAPQNKSFVNFVLVAFTHPELTNPPTLAVPVVLIVVGGGAITDAAYHPPTKVLPQRATMMRIIRLVLPTNFDMIN
jgi:hypothetical protein